MNPVRIVSASAGSGKTTRLARELAEAIAAGRARPEGIVATTFTVKAAAELQARVRTRLLREGRSGEAQRLALARIGTVNAVCGRLVQEFAFELGLSPDLRVLDEALAAEALKQALSEAVSEEEQAEIAEMVGRVGDPGWEFQKDVGRVVDLARANRIPAERLAECAARSADRFFQLLGGPLPDGTALDRALQDALRQFLEQAPVPGDETKTTADAITTARQALHDLERGHALPWKDWLALAGFKPGKKSDAPAQPVRQAAAAHDRHPRLHADARRMIELVFAVAARALESYQAYKRDWGVLDFVDQEALALDLLGRPDVRERLRGEIDLVLVDEFQDTSPIQLAIFLRLADVARESVWVGDQKQAIYGFRGTDPALMDAAIAALLGGAEPETLGTSYRSRAGLVRATSGLFAAAFAPHGIPPQRVRLEAHRPEHDGGPAEVLEVWELQAKNQGQDAAALAAAVAALLADPSVRVQAADGKGFRPVEPADVAVLCFRNKTCAEVARALQERGIRAVLPRAGLMATPEAVLALSGLRLWVDSGDALAAARLARLTAYPAGGDEWLAALVAGGREAFAALPERVRLRAAAEAGSAAGAVAALDRVLDLVDARERCLEWGDAAWRLANLDALRAHAVRYAEACAARGAAATAAGLAAHFEALAAGGEDAQGDPRDAAAVVVSTWHKAKGLEWPVTVLAELAGGPGASALGVTLVGREGPFDAADPLAERWIRFWPMLYHHQNNKAPFHQRLAESDETAAALRQGEDERRRLLYVGWTRSRDRLVLAARAGKLGEGMLSLLPGADALEWNEDRTLVRWAGEAIPARHRPAAPAEPLPSGPPEPGRGWVAAGPRDYPPAVVLPSRLEGQGRTGEPIRLHGRLAVSGDPDMGALGNAVHGFLAADRRFIPEVGLVPPAGGVPPDGAAPPAGLSPAPPPDERLALAHGLLARWGVAGAVASGDLVAAADAFWAWLESSWPGGWVRREWPVSCRLVDGSRLAGSADLVVEASGDLVLIDHKSFPGGVDEALRRAASHWGQLAAYAGALEAATGKPVRAVFIHLPLLGLVVPVTGE